MKFKVGDKIRIKSLQWYNENKDKNGYVYGIYPLIPFDPERAKYCGQEYEVVYVDKIDNTYQLDCGEEDIRTYWWTDEMIEKIDTKPLFTLTAKEVEIARRALCLLSNDMASYGPSMDKYVKFYYEGANNLLTRIKHWQDENKNSTSIGSIH